MVFAIIGKGINFRKNMKNNQKFISKSIIKRALILMKKIEIKAKSGCSQVFVGESIDNFVQYVLRREVFIISDQTVWQLYGERFSPFPVYKMMPGEESKSLDSIASIYNWLLLNNANRHAFVLGVGGGVVCDIAGFVASTYMRGVDFGFVSTTLLSQVDASVGGKNGVNLNGNKNIVGIIRQPHFVLCDPFVLRTLPDREFIAGLAEVVKHALIADYSMFEYIEQHVSEILNRNIKDIEYLVLRSVAIKSQIVQADEDEKNIRKTLNLGHTWGHAVELTQGLLHGESVSVGLVFAAYLSHHRQMMTKTECERVVMLLSSLGLPTIISGDYDQLLKILNNDKKRIDNSIDYILMKGIGCVEIVRLHIHELHEFVLTV